jgi:hypothetical protein
MSGPSERRRVRRATVALATVCVIALAGVSATAGAESPLERLQPGEWYEVPNSRLRAVLPNPKAPGDPRSIMGAWSGGTYDPVRDALILPANGGHEDYGGNEVYAFSLASLSWQRLTDPSPAPLPVQGQEELPDGRPASRHTYSGVTFATNVDKVFITGGALWSDAGGGSKGAWTFDVPSRTWLRRADAPGSQVTAMAAYDPVSGLVFSLVQDGTLAAYDPIKNRWSERGSIDWAGFDPARTMVVDPARRLLLVVGGGVVFRFDVSRSRPGRQDMDTTGGEPIVQAQGPGLAYDPVTDRIVGWVGGGDVYSLDVGARKWTRHPAVSTRVPAPAPRHGTYGRWQYIPSKNLFIGVNDIDENVWLYRLAVQPAARSPRSQRRSDSEEARQARPGWGWPGCAAGDCLRLVADTGAAPPGEGKVRPGATLNVPDRVWVSRPLGSGYGGPGLYPYASKHTRLIYDSKRSRMVLTGGDYSKAEFDSDNGSQMVWSIDLASGPAPRWTLLGPWCNGPEQPGRPDTVVWVYDSKRDQGVIMPGFYFITENEGSECPGVRDVADAMLFDFATNKWRRVPFAPPPGGYGGDLGSSFGVYDPVSDSVYRFRGDDDNVVEILSRTTNRWSVERLGGDSSLNRDQSVIDVQGRNIYAISRRPRGLLRYSIPKKRVNLFPLPAQVRLPEDEDLETYLAFDPINRVVLFPNTHDNGGRVHSLSIFHVDTQQWEWESTPSASPPVQGNVVAFDVNNNVMLLYGGKTGVDVGVPTVFWLYRYGRGRGASRGQ